MKTTRKSWKQIRAEARLANYWRKRWETQPDAMRANLDRLNKGRKDRAAERTRKLEAGLMIHLPSIIPSHELRGSIAAAMRKAGVEAPDPRRVNRVRMALIRRSLIVFDLAALAWRVVKTC